MLVVDKAEGPTSHDVVKFARRALGESRIGHTGTLDPMATGVLPLVLGRATRLAQFLTASDKTYEATITFGRSTNTCDATGTVIATSELRPTGQQFASALENFRGTYEQTPPAYSAKNIDGERSYDLARKAGTAVAQRPNAVTVTAKRVDVLAFDGETARLEMQVTAGFYVRSLAHDLGDALGCGAHLSALRRTRSGEFGLEHAVPLVDVLQAGREVLAGRIIPLSALLPDLAAVTLRGSANLERLKNGVEMGPSDLVTPFVLSDPQSAPEESKVHSAPEAPVVQSAPEAPRVIVRLLGPDGDLVGLARPGKTPGFLHGWVVLG
ncbi:MAG: tRNA pseudouridine(55) synthase TruB [Vicinamibacterales bacterium]